MQKKVQSDGFMVLAINPGATSTKFAVYRGETVLLKQAMEHSVQELKPFAQIIDQHRYRLALILQALDQAGIDRRQLSAVVGRGGLLKPLLGGTYRVNAQMAADMQLAALGQHASNLGAVMADDLAAELGIPAFIVDPVSVDEYEPVARVSGLADLERVSLSHALNMKAVARKAAKDHGRRYDEVNLIAAHLGSGVSVSVHRRGRMVDTSSSRDEGAFSPDRCGSLSGFSLVDLCFSGKYTYQEMRQKMMGTGGLFSYFGTRDVREVEKLAQSGNQKAALVLEALPYQVAKDIGAMAAVLAGQVDWIVLTGGMAYSHRIIDDVIRRVEFIAPVVVLPGEEELESLAFGVLRVLQGEEEAREYL
ncbi:butyrate kinase [Acetonema longum]|uniref:Probable butyrate kinase n=1 Tax=Acetonema longum DSM 6540 TaxID=1009370 RepID=F7NGC9_9FIRM|nr:butyrate kinase [Acetonema longum]EGO64884.1 butyrate kinase [Acetonema longum DSM 6540]